MILNDIQINSTTIHSNESSAIRTWFVTDEFTHKQVKSGKTLMVTKKIPVFLQEKITTGTGRMYENRIVAKFYLKKHRELFHPELFDY